jgi:hypothetical protein
MAMRGRRTGRGALRVGGSALLGALALSVVVACSSGSASSTVGAADQTSAAAAATQAPERAAAPDGPSEAASIGESAGGAAGGAADAATGSTGQLPITGQVGGTSVIRVADLALRLEAEPVPATDDATADREANAKARADLVAATAGTVRGIATTAGGFVAAADGGGSQLTVTVRVPADQYDAVLDKLAALGSVTNRTESSQDVTAQIVDVNSRVASMTASVARVRALLDQATTVADVISIESELSTREADLESLQQQQAALQGQVAMSTVTVGLTAVTLPGPGVVEPEPDNGFVAGVKAGWDNLLQFLSWLGALVGGLLPWLPLIALVVAVTWWAVRRLRRRGGPAGAGPNQGPNQGPNPGSGPAGEPDPAPAPDRGPNAPDESREPAGVR